MRASIRLIGSLRSNLYPIVAIGVFAVAGAQAAALEEVTVTAPTVKTIGRDASGTPIRQLNATVRVQYNPIMLTTNSGRALLDEKVAAVARMICSAGNTVPNTDDGGDCVQQAIKTAKSQLDAATVRIKG